MEKYKIDILLVSLILFCSCTNKEKSDVILFDATTSPLEKVSSQFGGVFEKRDSVLWIETGENNEFPGIKIDGTWDLSKCNQLVFELVNYEKQGDLPITVRLENQDANIDAKKGILIDRISVPSGELKEYSVSLPPKLPYPEIEEKLFGMRYTPYKLSALISNLDPGQVTGIAMYINKPKLNRRWGIKKITAREGTPAPLPAWMLLPSDKFFPFIDVYGQFIHKDWSGKTKLDNDLKEALNDELADIETHSGPTDRNQYGGWKNGPKQKATGHFYISKIDGKWWMVDPEGCLYWSHGVVRVTPSSAVTPLDNREFYFTGLPEEGTPFAEFYTTRDELLYPYYVARGIKKTYDFSAANIMRKYGENWRGKYAEMAHKRLKSWGLNTIANSSDKSICLMDKTPYTDRFELKSPDIEGSQNAWWKFKDPFHPEFRTNFRKQLLERKKELDDPWCFGFFVDNEIAWGGPTALAEWTLQSPAHQPAKIEMINRLKKKYGSIDALDKAWKSSYASWDALLESKVKPPVDSKDDCLEFTAAVTESYFKNIRDEFKKVAPDKLYMGCRFAGSNEVVIRIGAKYCDVISYNIYRHSLSNFSLPEGIDKPVMIGEFHFGALDRGLFHPGLIQTANQKERGEAYKTYVESALHHPNIIGTHWHQFSDQATTGRFDGEDFQVGFTDICDKPYPETIEKIREVGYNMYNIRSEK
ncbi:MAG: hypothetical protein A2W90_16160 [Bacteroidetes bacterium GWF2_42_66]|nr:MAG: hypothetical protein A2W92_08845 [Bacteroidetes bacterium GWA2_42_15]OFX96234.1 MAG: hypothetical protein A2W89_05090 [Bacteroidetes bacterium GWE2_42_39]OFY46273.1 MAG: hypothetical protein A2W90_16160 [Bacteroidetes bacterium GWF2_42_66]HAZ02599.1 beta-agarase [Marinilabiliales bacterium]HBL78350.1 beta-agarase [Prolixibacteraceae bacterium]